MFILKLALEMSVLVILFLLLRKSLFLLFPGLSKSARQSANNRRPLRSIIFLALGTVASLFFFWLFYGVIYLSHNWGDMGSALVISQMDLLAPSLIFGFYLSTHFSESLYRQFFIEPHHDWIQGHQQNGIIVQRVFSTVTLLPAILLLGFQFNTYLKVEGNKIYHKQAGESELVFAKEEVARISTLEDDALEIHLKDGRMISTNNLSGDYNHLLDYFMQ